MLSFRSSGSSKECMVGGSVKHSTQWVLRQEPGEGQLHCNWRFLLQSYPLKLQEQRSRQDSLNGPAESAYIPLLLPMSLMGQAKFMVSI